MEDHHPEVSEDGIHFFERELVVVDEFEAEGLVLDIGGGGEGVIGRLKGDQVIAIDPNERELEEAAEGPLKIIIDATNLQFLDESFTTVTSFYTLMYVEEQDALRQVSNEASRVLTAGGRFLIWDEVLPGRVEEHKDMAVFLLTVKLGEEEVDTGYGMLWPEEGRRASYCVNPAESAGFEVVRQNEEERQLFLELRQP